MPDITKVGTTDWVDNFIVRKPRPGFQRGCAFIYHERVQLSSWENDKTSNLSYAFSRAVNSLQTHSTSLYSWEQESFCFL